MSSSGVNHNWTAADDALLGKMPDGQVAQRIGVTPLSVFNRRKRLRIPAINRDAPPPAFLRSEAGSPSAPGKDQGQATHWQDEAAGPTFEVHRNGRL